MRPNGWKMKDDGYSEGPTVRKPNPRRTCELCLSVTSPAGVRARELPKIPFRELRFDRWRATCPSSRLPPAGLLFSRRNNRAGLLQQLWPFQEPCHDSERADRNQD